MTEPQKRALHILHHAGARGLHPREFAKLMWPDSPGWKRHARCGNKGSHRGGYMYTAAGGYLGRLWKLGLATYQADRSYAISRIGRELLQRERSK